MQCPPIVFMAFHVALFGLIATSYPEKYRVPLYVFGFIQGLVEHYADVLPSVAAVGPLLVPGTVAFLGIHYYYANKVLDNKALVWGGLAYYIAILFFFKGFELGFPKETAEEQIEALADDTYVTYHILLHVALLSCLSITAFSLPTTTTTTTSPTTKTK